jgi:hypothetical protein
MATAAKIKNVSGVDRLVPGLGGRLVMADAVVEVPAEDVHAYTCQESTWAPANKEAQAAHDKAVEANNPNQPEE